jgi:hypothetical protein
MAKPIFATSTFGSTVTVYDTHVEHKFFGQAVTIPINQIASVRQGITQRVIVETTGGRKIKMNVAFNAKDALCAAIMEAQSKNVG